MTEAIGLCLSVKGGTLWMRCAKRAARRRERRAFRRDAMVARTKEELDLERALFTTALCTAAQNGDDAAVQDLSSDASGGHALLVAAACGQEPCVHILCRCGAHAPSPVMSEDALWLFPGKIYDDDGDGMPFGNGMTPLFLASGEGHQSCVRTLLAFGVEVDEATDKGCTPLFVASKLGHAECLDVLIEARADVEALSYYWSPLRAACYRSHAACVQRLIRAGAMINAECLDLSALHEAIGTREGSLECVQSLLDAKAAVNHVCDGETPLLRAISWLEHGTTRIMIVQALLAAGANVNDADEDGCTPLHRAASSYPEERKPEELVHLLVAAAADVELLDNSGMTPLLSAINMFGFLNKRSASFRALLAAGADVNHANPRNGQSPLFRATFWGHDEIVMTLCEANAAVDQPNRRGITPLYGALLCDSRAYKDGDGRLIRMYWNNPLPSGCQWTIEHRLRSVQILSSYGATRHAHGCRPLKEVVESSVFIDAGSESLLEWLRQSCDWTALQHVEVLTAERTRALLRDGADVHAGSPSPHKRAAAAASAEVGRMLELRAARWSPYSHSLFPEPVRARAWQLVRLGVLLARGDHGLPEEVWLFHVIPHALA